MNHRSLLALVLALSLPHSSRAGEQIALTVDRPHGRHPGQATRLLIKWLPHALTLNMSPEAQFELLSPVDDRVALCGVSEERGGGLAIFWRGDTVAEYGCWVAVERAGEAWVQFEMNSGIAMRLPVRAFSKRLVRDLPNPAS